MPLRFALESARWTVRALPSEGVIPPSVGTRLIPATVPGCVHTDLLDAGLIGDVNAGTNEAAATWVSLTDWEYTGTFVAPPDLFDHEEIDLVFDEGLDTLAEVWVNGIHIGIAANEFTPHRWSVGVSLKSGQNEIRVVLRSALSHVRQEAQRLGPRPVNGDWDPFIFIRKCASNFGWDWGPKVATCGIGGGVRLEAWSVARLESPRTVVLELPPADCEDAAEAKTRWDVQVHAGLVWSHRAMSDDQLELELTFEHSGDPASPPVRGRALPTPGARSVTVNLEVRSDERWWPRGYGKPVLHQLSCELRTIDASRSSKASLGSAKQRIGLRTASLRRTNADGSPAFSVQANSVDILCVGANWIPEGLWPRDRTPERVRPRLVQLAEAGMNMIRIWGGGRYEPAWFYELCDELGIAVWQDFMFTCACYPEEQPIWSLIEQEARHQIARLSGHPSILLWCGGNECVWAHANWGFKEKLPPEQTWGRAYWFEMLPRLMNELDPARPYWPNSPWSGDSTTAPNELAPGDRHTWDIDLISDRPPVPLFCSEFGQQSLPSIMTLTEALGPSALAMGAPWLQTRQRGPGGNSRWFTEPFATHDLFAPRAGESPEAAFTRWHAAGQELQARALVSHLSWLLAHRERCSGALIWQLNDAWAGPSWSLVDSAGRPKPAYFAVQQLLATIRWPVPPTSAGQSTGQSTRRSVGQ